MGESASVIQNGPGLPSDWMAYRVLLMNSCSKGSCRCFPQIAERAPTLLKITVGFIYPREGVKTMAKKKRLISGEKFYCRCPSCSETWDYPPVISYLDDENTLPITDRHTTCTATDPTQDMAYNFSIALSCRDEKTQDKCWQVIRGCSAHRNFHYHHYKYRSDRSVVEENHPLRGDKLRRGWFLCALRKARVGECGWVQKVVS